MARPIHVVFLTFYFEAWDAVDAVYKLMLKDDRFRPEVVTIPRKLTGDKEFNDRDRISQFFDEKNIPHTFFDFPDGKEGLERLAQLDPDYIFLNYPWQRNYQTGYQIVNLVGVSKVCYVPYFTSSLVQEPRYPGVPPHQYTQSTHQLAHMVFLQDEETKEAFDHKGRASQAFLVGNPKVDALLDARNQIVGVWPLSDNESRFRLVWAPHHSYDNSWLNFGHFVDQKDHMLSYARDNQDVDIVFRPHPILFGTLTDRNLLSPDELNKWRQEWDELPNTFTDLCGPMVELLLASDALLTDGVSFLIEYPLITGKPAIFWEKPDHWPFTRMGELAADACVSVSTWSEVERVLNEARMNCLPDRTQQITKLVGHVRPQQGSAAETIVELIAKDFYDSHPQS